MSPMRSSFTHAALILGSGVLWGTAGAAAQIAPSIGPAALADGRLIVGAAVLAIFIGPVRLWRELKTLSLPNLVLASLAMGLFQWSFFAAAVGIGGGSATLISVGASPLLADLVAARERHAVPPSRWWVEAAGYLLGLALLVEGFNLPREGVLAALFAGAAYAVYAETVSRMERRGGSRDAGISVTTLALAGGGIALLPAASAQFESLLSPSGLMMTAYLGLLVTALAYGMFVVGLHSVNVGTALALQIVQPVAAIIIDGLLPSPHPYGLASNGLVIIGTAIIVGSMGIRTFAQPLKNRSDPCPNLPAAR
jgi:DME family drug/metabolite transporter